MPLPQSSNGLTQMAGGYMPLASGIAPTRMTGMEGMPLLASGGLLSAAGMFMSPQLMRAMGSVGMLPSGLGHEQNVYDTLLHQRFTQMQNEAVRQAAMADYQSFMRTFRGIAAITGTPWGAPQRQAAGTLASGIGALAPLMVDIAPDLLDQMGGARGSAAVLARNLIDAGRYRIDPVSGRMGFSGETAGHVARELYSSLYDRPDLQHMRGVSAGQLGGLFEEMTMRGMLPSADPRGRHAQVLSILQDNSELASRAFRGAGIATPAQLGALSTQQLDQLSQMPDVASQLRTLDTSRISRSLQGYLGVVSSMRDIFGDMGRPNAPMRELVAALEAFTMGGMAQFDPSRLSQMVRQTYGMARMAGVTTDAALLMQREAATRAGQLGIDPVFAVQATQGSLAFSSAYRASGMAGNPFWGAYDADQLTQLDQTLRVQASASPMANRLGALMRLRDMGSLTAGSAGAAAAQAVALGFNDFVDPRTGRRRSVSMSEADTVSLLEASTSGFNEGDLRNLLHQTDTNRASAAQYDIQTIVRRAQGAEELVPWVRGRVQDSLTTRLSGLLASQGVAGSEAWQRGRAAAIQITTNLTNRIHGLDDATFTDTGQRDQAIATAIDQELSGAGLGGILGDMTMQQRQQWLRQTSNLMVGDVNSALQSSSYRAVGNWGNLRRLDSPQVLNEADRQSLQVRLENQTREALTPLGHGSMLRRLVDALQGTRPDDANAVTRVLGQMTGGVDTQAISTSLQGPLTQLRAQQQRVDALQQQILGSEPSSPARQSLLAQLETANRELTAQVAQVAQVGERFGIGAQSLSADVLDRALDSRGQLFQNIWDISGLRAGYGDQVTEAQRAVIRNEPPRPLTLAESTAVLQASRQRRIEMLETGGASDEERTWVRDRVQEEIQRSPGINVSQARARLAARMRSQPVTAGEAESYARTFTFAGAEDVELDALERLRRRRTPTAASAEDISEVRQLHPELNEAEAREVAQLRLLHARLGIAGPDTAQEISQLMEEPRFAAVNRAVAARGGELATLADVHRRYVEAGRPNFHEGGTWLDPVTGLEYNQERYDRYLTAHNEERASLTGQPGSGMSRAEAMRELLRRRERAQFDPTSITNDEVAAERQRDPTLAAATVSDTQVRSAILRRRQRATYDRFNQFWGSDDGAAFRMSVDEAFQDVETVADHLVGSRSAATRFGARAVEMHETLVGGQRRLRTLAALHAGGDMARLLSRHLAVDLGTAAGQETYQAVSTEVDQILQGQQTILHDLRESQGRPGRQWRLGNLAEATARVDALALELTPEQRTQRIEQERIAIGNREEARQILGLPSDRPLTAHEQQQLDDTTRQVAVARQLTPEQEGQLDSQAQRRRRLQQFAGNLGVSLEEAVAFGRGRPVADRDLGDMSADVESARQTVGEAGNRRAAAEMQLNALLAELRGLPAGDPRRQDLLRRIQEQSTIIETSRQQERTAHSRLQTTATYRGTTTADLIGGTHRGAARLSGLSAAEQATRNRAGGNWRQGRDRVAHAQAEISRLQQALQSTPIGQGRTALQQQLESQRIRLAEAQQMMTQAEAQAAPILNARGVTATQFFSLDSTTPGFMTEGQRTDLGTEAQGFEQGQGQLQEIQTQTGAQGLADVEGARTVMERVARMQQQRQQLMSQTPQQLVQTFGQAFNLSLSDDRQRQLSQLLSGPRARAQIADAIGTQQVLRNISQRVGAAGSVDTLVRDYYAAVNSQENREAAIRTFRSRYGIQTGQNGQLTAEGETDWRQLTQAVEFQNRFNLLRVGRPGQEGIGEAGLNNLFNTLIHLGQQPPAGSGGAGGGSGSMVISGSVRIENGNIVLSSVEGRNDVVVPR